MKLSLSLRNLVQALSGQYILARRFFGCQDFLPDPACMQGWPMSLSMVSGKRKDAGTGIHSYHRPQCRLTVMKRPQHKRCLYSQGLYLDMPCAESHGSMASGVDAHVVSSGLPARPLIMCSMSLSLCMPACMIFSEMASRSFKTAHWQQGLLSHIKAWCPDCSGQQLDPSEQTTLRSAGIGSCFCSAGQACWPTPAVYVLGILAAVPVAARLARRIDQM